MRTAVTWSEGKEFLERLSGERELEGFTTEWYNVERGDNAREAINRSSTRTTASMPFLFPHVDRTAIKRNLHSASVSTFLSSSLFVRILSSCCVNYKIDRTKGAIYVA